MPLGILLAAAWIDVLSLQEIAAEITQSLDILETEMRDVPARQRSLRAVFDTSWEHLTGVEQGCFQKLSVFRGSFTRAAAEQVTSASLRQLAGLVKKSFLRRNTDNDNYGVHELLRQYAQERLEADPQAVITAREAHAAYYADFMQFYPRLPD